MPILSNVLKYRDVQRENVAWQLLRAQNASYIIAILDAHLGSDVTRRSVSEMENLVDSDIEELRERMLEMPLVRSAAEYLEDWRRAGYLVRKPSAESRQETYELSGGALAAIGFAKGLAQPRRTATKSRLSIIFDQIASLSMEVSSDDARRREALLAERVRIDEKLASLDAGLYEQVEAADALEQAREIIGLAREIPLDFAYVSAEFERLSKDLYAKLISYDEGYADMLEDVFAGVDHIAQSPAGSSFRGFYALLQDYEESERLYDNIDVILDAEFAQSLTPEQRSFLRRLVRMLLEQSRDVNETMTGLARGLRRFVQSQSFQENRELKRLLDRSLSLASELTDALPAGLPIDIELDRTATRIEPVSRLRLRDPGDDAMPDAREMLLLGELPAMTIADLREQVREVEIDFDELVSNVNACLEAALERNEGVVSVAGVLEEHPATQGVASIVGLMMLADEQGRRGEGVEYVSWTAPGGMPRRAVIQRYEFMQEVA